MSVLHSRRLRPPVVAFAVAVLAVAAPASVGAGAGAFAAGVALGAGVSPAIATCPIGLVRSTASEAVARSSFAHCTWVASAMCVATNQMTIVKTMSAPRTMPNVWKNPLS